MVGARGGRLPIFNAGKQDLVATLLLLLFLGSALLVLRASQQHMNEAGGNTWKNLAVIVGSILFLALVFVVCMKVIYNYICCFTDEYEEIASKQEEEVAILRSNADLESGLKTHQQPDGKDSDVKQKAAQAQVEKFADSLRGEDEIDCGIELEGSVEDFEYNGVKHSSGCLRISKVEPYGCCDRQAVCGVGDILVTVDGKDVHGMHPGKVQKLLRGKPGCSIVLGMYTKLSRGIIHR
ncbi:hypothetical protein GUITHDRAFT_161172 [Guillardia theta CCMP2712]|uniref:PDZ domain-containing protein n=1 Tax=Guillardia theta (strain CCMP2712) TaxID=905079 RepID=L1JXM5_GUITC|nr:hypothetical protein GUITHDRAFT_161172 [Guillardia theta CCMP2712]EKX53122.1 hypothetical protein GUITHDRAFT_161172 [Guillardia theta CCMP2712]|eukprot:XP_005840102.1 hypothetical protein GUITHDRAFT_161172 [Guillardia theta CCMP2712]